MKYATKKSPIRFENKVIKALNVVITEAWIESVRKDISFNDLLDNKMTNFAEDYLDISDEGAKMVVKFIKDKHMIKVKHKMLKSFVSY